MRLQHVSANFYAKVENWNSHGSSCIFLAENLYFQLCENNVIYKTGCTQSIALSSEEHRVTTPGVTYTENFVKFGCVVFDIRRLMETNSIKRHEGCNTSY